MIYKSFCVNLEEEFLNPVNKPPTPWRMQRIVFIDKEEIFSFISHVCEFGAEFIPYNFISAFRN